MWTTLKCMTQPTDRQDCAKFKVLYGSHSVGARFKSSEMVRYIVEVTVPED